MNAEAQDDDEAPAEAPSSPTCFTKRTVQPAFDYLEDQHVEQMIEELLESGPNVELSFTS